MKVGDIVTVRDGSYSMCLGGNGRLEHECGNNLRERHWKVLAKDLVLPTDGEPYGGYVKPNDIMLCEQKAPEHLLFTREHFCVVTDRPEPNHETVVVPKGTESITISFA